MFDTLNTRSMSTHRLVMTAMEILAAQPDMLFFIEENAAAVYIVLRFEAQCREPNRCTPQELADAFIQHLKKEWKLP